MLHTFTISRKQALLVAFLATAAIAAGPTFATGMTMPWTEGKTLFDNLVLLVKYGAMAVTFGGLAYAGGQAVFGGQGVQALLGKGGIAAISGMVIAGGSTFLDNLTGASTLVF